MPEQIAPQKTNKQNRIHSDQSPTAFTFPFFLFALLALALSISGCDRSTPPAEESSEIDNRDKQLPSDGALERHENYTEMGDLPAIKRRGIIRFVSLSAEGNNLLPRAAVVGQHNFEAAKEFAEQLGLQPRWIAADTPIKALQLINEGRADVVTSNLTRRKGHDQDFDLTETILKVHQQLLTGRKGPKIGSIGDIENLKNITFSVLADSTYLNTAKELQKKIPQAKINVVHLTPEDTVDSLIDGLNSHLERVTILDTNVIAGLLTYRNDITPGAIVSGEEDIVWAMRKNSPELKLRLNNFLTSKMVHAPKVRSADWPEIKKSKVIRFLTYNGPTSYYMWRGELMGFDYDLAKKFAQENDLALQLVVVPYDQSLTDWLKAGRGDFAGASTTMTKEREAEGITFTAPYIEVRQQLLSNRQNPPINSLQALNGRTLTLRKYSAFIDTALALGESGITVNIEVAEPATSYEKIINMVASGEADATIVDANAAEIESALSDTLTPGIFVSDPLPQGWMVTQENKQLLKKLSNFIGAFRKTKLYETKVKTYFEPSPQGSKKLLGKLEQGQDLSPYDELIKYSAREHEFDWRLIVAQMWQESSFNPKAVSPVGAQGLLQVMPKTAGDMGFSTPLFDPEKGISAGVKYLAWVRDRLDKSITLENRLWFSLAAYNAGIGHLYDARRLAEELELDPNVWFDNVEVAMLKLSEPSYFKNARYGYVRGAEPVHYVRNIRHLYRAYTDISAGDIARLVLPGLIAPLSIDCRPRELTNPRKLLFKPLLKPPLNRQHYFSDMRTGLHQAVRLGNFCQGVACRNQGANFSGRDLGP